MIVHLVRHGQSYNTHPLPEEPDPQNPPLTPTGQRQAQLVGERLATLGVDRLVTSPMVRTVETADYIGRAAGRPVEVLSCAFEHRAVKGWMNWGRRRLLEAYPTLVVPEDLADEGFLYGDEPLEQAVERAGTFAGWLRAQALGGGGQLVVVTHAAITRLVLERMVGLPPRGLAGLTLANTSLCSLRFHTHEMVDHEGELHPRLEILALNDTTHLAGLGDLDPMVGISR